MKKTYEDWEKELDAAIQKEYFISLMDGIDCCFYDWYEDGVSVKSAVKKWHRVQQGMDE